MSTLKRKLTFFVAFQVCMLFNISGQFGMPSFSGSALVGCLLATMLSILDSVGDYFACAKACRVPPPPRHAVNRGLTIEGICSFLAGSVGCGHATTTYAGNIGAMGLTKVLIMMLFKLVVFNSIIIPFPPADAF